MAAPTTSTLFTPDEALDLLFSLNLISFEVKKALHPDVHVRTLRLLDSRYLSAFFYLQIRPLASTDYWRGHLRVLSVLTAAPDTGEERWRTHFNFLRNSGRTYYTVVIVDKASDQIVGVGTVFLECKFQRGISCVGHIEDIAVDEKQQGKKLGLRIIQALTYISENSGAYKTILNCSDKNIPFYEKCGYEKKENEMVHLDFSFLTLLF
ncbi:Glucosamine 6-phosphate N-acetyltransferase 1 [Termitomyces sp. J132]|nr:Glucosamine 6-phosphate N-acetyltransferase 1 [Termitomyces sp. J132]